ncbi:MAG: hypothetical protein K5668_09140 [Lachnospiraceae bacterium]|nr:hypothetical protein [Lachnospiraceae bacterium]
MSHSRVQKLYRHASRLLILLFLFESLFFKVGEEFIFAAGTSGRIEITSNEDLIRLSEKAGDGTYTAGKSFYLTKDLDLNGVKFQPIQVFSGSFDGGGHVIRGFSFEGNISGGGLFRAILEGAEVKDLTVETEMQPRGDMNNIGGIAGINQGVIRNCMVKGHILGMEAVGGIAGRNTETGLIAGCVNKAFIHGMRRTGGIAGFNEGSVESCENNGDINSDRYTAWEIDDNRTKAEDERLIETGEEGDTGENRNLDKAIPDSIELLYNDLTDALSNDQEVNYTGGVAGVNAGEIKNCKNSGIVGYEHLGYKSGGICGYDRGIIDNCVNSGNIYGRKTTGGIVGQFEPFVQDEFEEDSLGKADKEADVLVDLITALQSEFKTEDDNIQEKIDGIRSRADDLRGSIHGYKDYYRGKDDVMEADLRSHTNSIRDIINDLDINIKNKKANEAIKAMRSDFDDLDNLMHAAEKAASSGVAVDISAYISKLRTINKDIDKQSDTLLEITQGAGKEYNEARKASNKLRDETNSLDDFLRSAYDSYKTDLRSTDDDITNQIDTIAECMDILSDALKNADGVVRKKMDGITTSLSRLSVDINDGMGEVREELTRLKNTKDLDDIFDDISDDSDSTPAKGRITSCENTGRIMTDINGGGIAGMVDTDFDLQSDFSVDKEGDYSMNRTKTKRAVINGCRNSGNVIVKNEYAGGIAGNMDIGAVVASCNFGAVETEKGDYAGGIAGKSGYMIRDSFSMGQVSGNRYVGGIAGYGTGLVDNKALVSIQEGVEEKFGAIAGDTDLTEKTVSGNYFVSDSVGAINGLTFDDEAKAVSFEEFIRLPGVPAESSKMTVTFVSRGETLKTILVPYGGSVQPEEYPELPEDDEMFGAWEDKDLSDVRQNTVVNAVYISYVTTVASGEHFPVLLITGCFHEDTSVNYEKEDITGKGYTLPEGYESVLAKYDFRIVTDYPLGDKEAKIRLLADDYDKKDTAALMNKDGSFEILNTVRDGRYMIFTCPRENEGGSFYILKGNLDPRQIAFFVVVGGVILLLLAIRFIRTGRCHRALRRILRSKR